MKGQCEALGACKEKKKEKKLVIKDTPSPVKDFYLNCFVSSAWIVPMHVLKITTVNWKQQ